MVRRHFDLLDKAGAREDLEIPVDGAGLEFWEPPPHDPIELIASDEFSASQFLGMIVRCGDHPGYLM